MAEQSRTDDPALPTRLISGERQLPGGRSKHWGGLRVLQDTRVEGGQDSRVVVQVWRGWGVFI